MLCSLVDGRVCGYFRQACVIPAPKLGHFGLTHLFIHLFKDNLLGFYTELGYYAISQGCGSKTQPCYQELTIKWGCQTSEEVVCIKCGIRKEVCTTHNHSKI